MEKTGTILDFDKTGVNRLHLTNQPKRRRRWISGCEKVGGTTPIHPGWYNLTPMGGTTTQTTRVINNDKHIHIDRILYNGLYSSPVDHVYKPLLYGIA